MAAAGAAEAFVHHGEWSASAEYPWCPGREDGGVWRQDQKGGAACSDASQPGLVVGSRLRGRIPTWLTCDQSSFLFDHLLHFVIGKKHFTKVFIL